MLDVEAGCVAPISFRDARLANGNFSWERIPVEFSLSGGIARTLALNFSGDSMGGVSTFVFQTKVG
jgi:hypothetical protein